MTTLVWLDWLVIGGYFAAVAAVVWFTARQQSTSEDYFLAGRNIGWFAIGASLFASNIGSEHLVGLAGAGAKSGVAMAHYELHAWCLLMLGWVLVPFYYRAGIYTVPEFLERRFNPACRWILSLVSLIAYVFTKVSVTVYAGGMVFQTLIPELQFAGLNSFWIGAVSVVLLTGVYTMVGGLRAVVYTDAMQTVVLLLGSLCITLIGLYHLGGWSVLREMNGSVRFNLWRPASDPEFPWPGMLFAAPIVGLWYWGADQYIVQRTLAARSLKIARRGTIFGAYLKITPVFLFIVPGMIAYALVQKGMLVMDSPDQAFAALVTQLLPQGVRGLVVGGLLAALMSSLSSLFNSCSTLFTVDIYKKLKPAAPESELVRVGRIATGVVVGLGLLWIPAMQLVSGALYEYLQSVQAYLAPPMTAVFFLGIFWKRINGTGAVVTLVSGFVLGLAKLGAQIYAGIAVSDMIMQKPWILRLIIAYGNINFLLFCVYLFLYCCTVLVLVSLLSAAPTAAQTTNLCYSGNTEAGRREVRESWNYWDVIHTAAVLLLILSVYLYFTG
ncbi:MAG TPA: sodium:solute symporter [Candidatus Hydrogenedentes bacterium]|jgi:SSS family solute:Na+ symporter|nr:MAG: Sodium/glucose cotransporter [Candidatus Hydrogenedentes bacterium ADurb.Bin170]HNZ48434.1 sodium:solute symporter [Candidatus Hydrogenedentota bacterium]HPX86740.1 sodium:solute symporter [Candidatus Hydrogenedentota bacterium]HQB02606.1 sodium:solute symporter [Candidatus Hydrogenedentota bacterium]